MTSSRIATSKDGERLVIVTGAAGPTRYRVLGNSLESDGRRVLRTGESKARRRARQKPGESLEAQPPAEPGHPAPPSTSSAR